MPEPQTRRLFVQMGTRQLAEIPDGSLLLVPKGRWTAEILGQYDNLAAQVEEIVWLPDDEPVCKIVLRWLGSRTGQVPTPHLFDLTNGDCAYTEEWPLAPKLLWYEWETPVAAIFPSGHRYGFQPELNSTWPLGEVACLIAYSQPSPVVLTPYSNFVGQEFQHGLRLSSQVARVPELIIRKEDQSDSRLAELILSLPDEWLSRSGESLSATEVRTGLLCWHGFFEQSHEQAQSIEHQGNLRQGDYWHGILHRREPDYSNSRYWFQNFLRESQGSPDAPNDVLQSIAISTCMTLEEHSMASAWRDKLISPIDSKYIAQVLATPLLDKSLKPLMKETLRYGTWNPLAFVDLCERAIRSGSAELQGLARLLQRDEMMALLNQSAYWG